MLFDRLKAIAAGPGGDADGLRIVAAKGLVAISEPTSAVLHDKLLSEALSSAEQARAPQDVLNWLEIERTILRVVWSRSGSDVPKADTSTLIALSRQTGGCPGSARIGHDPYPGCDQDLQSPEGEPVAGAAAAASRVGRPPGGQPSFAGNSPICRWPTMRHRGRISPPPSVYFSATGLTEEQCAPSRDGSRSCSAVVCHRTTFPDTSNAIWLRRLGVNVEYDIRSDGSTAGLRPTIALSAFHLQFRRREWASPTSRFQASYRPEGGNACSANRTSILLRAREVTGQTGRRSALRMPLELVARGSWLTWSTLVEPGVPKGTPASTMILSPALDQLRPDSAMRLALAIIFLRSCRCPWCARHARPR